MAGSVNKVIVVGHLGADPEVRYTGTGDPVCNFRVATSESWTKDGQKQERTEWHRVTVWGKLAEICGKYLAKGRQVYVEGKLQTREFENRDGQKQKVTEIQARDVVFIGGGKAGGEQPAATKGATHVLQGGEKPSQDSDYGPPPASDDDVPF